MPESRSLVVDTDEDLGDVLLRGFLILRCRGLADVDRRKPVVADRMRTIEVALHGVLVLFVDRAPFVPERVHEIAPDLWLGRVPFHSSVTLGRNSGSLRIAASATSNRPSRGRNAIVIFRVAPSLPTTSTPRITA